MISQQLLVDNFLPYLLQHGRHYKKTKQVKARAAVTGEIIGTQTSDGAETTNTAAEGDFVVQNMTAQKEEYIVKPAAFHQKYKLADKSGEGWDIYDPVGEIVALEVNELMLQQFGWNSPFYIEASWKEKMIVRSADFLATPLPNANEVYRIARTEFFETYADK